MPIYEYKCLSCGRQFEELVFSMSAPPPDCPDCQSDEVEKMMSAAAVRPAGVPKGKGGWAAPKCGPGAGKG